MELVLFPSYFSPYTSQGVFHGGTIELCQIFVELPIRRSPLRKASAAISWLQNGMETFFFIEPSHVVSEWLCSSLLDVIEVA